MSRTLKDLITSQDLIGRDMELVESGVRYRGPISETHIDPNGTSHFHVLWKAEKRPGTDAWRRYRESGNVFTAAVDLTVELTDPDASVHFLVPGCGYANIYPDGDNIKKPE